MEFYMRSLTCTCACAWAAKTWGSFWLQCKHTHSPFHAHILSHTHSHFLLGISSFRGISTGLHSGMLPGSASGCPQEDITPLSSCWAFLFQIGLWWKRRLLIIRKYSNRRPVLSLPFVLSHKETRVPSSYPHPPANRNWKIWAILRTPFFPSLCQCPSCRCTLFSCIVTY